MLVCLCNSCLIRIICIVETFLKSTKCALHRHTDTDTETHTHTHKLIKIKIRLHARAGSAACAWQHLVSIMDFTLQVNRSLVCCELECSLLCSSLQCSSVGTTRQPSQSARDATPPAPRCYVLYEHVPCTQHRHKETPHTNTCVEHNVSAQ